MEYIEKLHISILKIKCLRKDKRLGMNTEGTEEEHRGRGDSEEAQTTVYEK